MVASDQCWQTSIKSKSTPVPLATNQSTHSRRRNDHLVSENLLNRRPDQLVTLGIRRRDRGRLQSGSALGTSNDIERDSLAVLCAGDKARSGFVESDVLEAELVSEGTQETACVLLGLLDG